MARQENVLISKSKLEEARKVRDELSSLIETAEILNNKPLIKSIKKGEQDLKEGRYHRAGSGKEIDSFFEG